MRKVMIMLLTTFLCMAGGVAPQAVTPATPHIYYEGGEVDDVTADINSEDRIIRIEYPVYDRNIELREVYDRYGEFSHYNEIITKELRETQIIEYKMTNAEFSELSLSNRVFIDDKIMPETFEVKSE